MMGLMQGLLWGHQSRLPHGREPGKVGLGGGKLVEATVTTRVAGTGAGALRAVKAAEATVTTRVAGTGAGVRTAPVVKGEILVVEGIQARTEGETGGVDPPEHSSSASFCVFCDEGS